MNNRLSLFEEISDERITFYKKLNLENTDFDSKCSSIKNFLVQKVDELILELQNSGEKYENFDEVFFTREKFTKEGNKSSLISFLCQIKESYGTVEFEGMIKKKIKDISGLEDKNYELSIDAFLEKFKNMFIKKHEKQLLNFNYFYEDLFITLHKFLLVNDYSELICRIIIKLLISAKNKKTTNFKFSNKLIEKVNNQNELILKLLINTKEFDNINQYQKLINFSSAFLGFLLALVPQYEAIAHIDYKLLSKFFAMILSIDLDGKFDKYKIITSSVTINTLVKIQGVETFLLQNFTSDEELGSIFNSNITKAIKLLHEIFTKYNLQDENNNQIIGVIHTEISQISKKFLRFFFSRKLERGL